MAATMNPKRMHPPTLLGCIVILAVVLVVYHFVFGHNKKG